jgi:hypothetical protein
MFNVYEGTIDPEFFDFLDYLYRDTDSTDLVAFLLGDGQ